ncbi:hypothetical protein BJ170DRAFT_682705 [Xylariales sp. AK1849]|nr:hypothetical protein BJ170DRAFT_682705 [Xylariales sp. AK1849]
MRRGLLFFAACSILIPPFVTAQTCYHLDGSQTDSSQNAPCNATATGESGSHSACCNFANSDACLSSGLCLNTESKQPSHILWATGCTDSTAQDASCPQFCHGGKFSNAYLQPCNDTHFCCNELGPDGSSASLADTACCADSFLLGAQISTVVRQLQGKSSAGTASTSTSASIAATGSAGAQTPDTCDAVSSTPGGGVVAGLAVEGALLLLTLIGLALMLSKNRNLKRELSA